MKIHHTKTRKRYAADCSEDVFLLVACGVMAWFAIAAIVWSVLRIVGVI